MKTWQKDSLEVRVFDTRKEMGEAAAADFAAAVAQLLTKQERVRVIFAAAPSQNDFLSAAVARKDIDFSAIDGFHMDEYIGLRADAPQGFGNFLKDRIFSLREFRSVSYLNGQGNSAQACKDYAAKLNEAPIDIVCMGIGENGHIAFNDPAVARFDDPEDVKVVDLDDVCRMQQVHDGCFASLDEVPKQAMTLTVPLLMKAKYHFCMVPAATKAQAVKRLLTGDIDESCPCTIMRQTPGCILYLDQDSSSLL